jgi:hypothetical protein
LLQSYTISAFEFSLLSHWRTWPYDTARIIKIKVYDLVICKAQSSTISNANFKIGPAVWTLNQRLNGPRNHQWSQAQSQCWTWGFWARS